MDAEGAPRRRAGTAVEPIDVLRNQGEPIEKAVFQPDQRLVRWVGLACVAEPETAQVPAPDLLRMGSEHARRGHLVGDVVA